MQRKTSDKETNEEKKTNGKCNEIKRMEITSRKKEERRKLRKEHGKWQRKNIKTR